MNADLLIEETCKVPASLGRLVRRKPIHRVVERSGGNAFRGSDPTELGSTFPPFGISIELCAGMNRKGAAVRTGSPPEQAGRKPVVAGERMWFDSTFPACPTVSPGKRRKARGFQRCMARATTAQTPPATLTL